MDAFVHWPAYVTIDAGIANSFITSAEKMEERGEDYWIYPDSIGNEVWHLVHQPRDCWTFDHWVRPFGENW